jgi:hypothetical protein
LAALRFTRFFFGVLGVLVTGGEHSSGTIRSGLGRPGVARAAVATGLLALPGPFGVGCGAMVRLSAGGIAACVPATLVCLVRRRVLARARRLVRA